MKPPGAVFDTDGYHLVAWTFVGERQRPTGRAVHIVFGRRAGPAAGLAICTFDQDRGGGFYLFSCNEDWEIESDTYHESLEAALAQAAREYEGIESWQYAV